MTSASIQPDISKIVVEVASPRGVGIPESVPSIDERLHALRVPKSRLVLAPQPAHGQVSAAAAHDRAVRPRSHREERESAGRGRAP